MDAHEFREVFPRLGKSLSEHDAAGLLAALTPRAYSNGERLCTFGEPSDTLHLITSGQVAIRVKTGGETLYLGQAGRGGIVGEVGVIEPGSASATVEAMEPVTTLDLDSKGLDRLSRDEPGAASALLLSLSLELAHRVRGSSTDILKRIDDHAWMRAEAKRDRKGWLGRLARLIHGGEGAAE